MSPYRVKYTESESDIHNYNSLYKNTKKNQNIFENKKKRLFCLKHFGTFQKSKFFKNTKFYVAFCIRSTIHIFYTCFWFVMLFIVWKRKFQKSKKIKISNLYLVLCIRSIIHIFFYKCHIFIIFIILTYFHIFIYLYNYLIFIYLYRYSLFVLNGYLFPQTSVP